MKPEKILQEVIVWSLGLAVLLLPSFFLPITSEWFEWNKHYLLGILVTVALLAWLGQGMVTKKLSLARAPFDIPLAGWLIVLLISSVLSKDQIVSFFGLSENVSGGFLSFVFFSLLALLVVWNIRSAEVTNRFLTFFALGGGIAAVYFWLGRFGILKSLARFVPQWNPSALLNNHFAVIMAFFVVLALGILLIPRLAPRKLALWGVIGFLSLAVVVVLGFKTGWIALTVGCFILLLLSIPRIGEVRYPVLSLNLVLFVLSLVFWILGTPQFLRISAPTEITLARPRSFQITYDTLKEGAVRLFFGSGPDTFGYNFSEHRPASYNLSPTWNIRFSGPAATSYHLASGSGVIGSLAFLILLLVGGGMALQGWMRAGGGLLKNRRKTTSSEQLGGAKNPEMVGEFFAVAALWLTATVMLFFVAYGTVLWMMFFVPLALLVVIGNQAGLMSERTWVVSLKATPQYALATSFIYIVVVTAAVIGGVFLGRFYGSDVVALRAARAASRQDFLNAEEQYQRAVRLNPYRAGYEIGRADTFLRHAAFESRRETPNTQLVGQLVGSAINSSQRATVLAPRSTFTWEQLTRMYENARPFSREANGWVINSLNRAIEIEKTNPRLHLVRSIAYRREEKLVEAEADNRKAIELKPNYAAAHYALSVFLEQKKDLDGAVASARGAVQFAPRALDAQFNLGRLLYNRNKDQDWVEAERVFRRIVSQNKDYGNAVFSLGLLLERQGKISEARTFYERALELDPQNSAVRARLDRLGRNVPAVVEPEPEELPEEE